MKRGVLRDILVFYQSDLPTCRRQEECGFSLHLGVLVCWDEDQDARILTFLDNLPPSIRSELLVVQETRGGLSLLWRNKVPRGYRVGNQVDIGGDDIDYLEIWSSKGAGQ